MLLPGLREDPPTLDYADIEGTKDKARSSGRSFGGAPLRNGSFRGGRGGRYSNGDGGRINYAANGGSPADNRPNPFAQHIQPGFMPPPYNAPNNGYGGGGGRGGPQGYPPYQGAPPPIVNFSQSYPPGPPPQQGGYNNTFGGMQGPPPPQAYGNQGYGGPGGYGNQGGYGAPHHQTPSTQYRNQQQQYDRGYERQDRALPDGYGYNRR